MQVASQFLPPGGGGPPEGSADVLLDVESGSSSSPPACPPAWTALPTCARMPRRFRASGSSLLAGWPLTLGLSLLLTRVSTWWFGRGAIACCLLSWGGFEISAASTVASGVDWWAAGASELLALEMGPSRSCVRIFLPFPLCILVSWRSF